MALLTGSLFVTWRCHQLLPRAFFLRRGRLSFSAIAAAWYVAANASSACSDISV
jgi:hypothetical protein